MPERFERFADRIDFYSASQTDKILAAMWFLHDRGRDRVVTGEIRKLFDAIHLDPPNISAFLSNLTKTKPKRVLRDSTGFRLEGGLRRRLDSEYRERDGSPTEIAVRALLKNYIEKVSDENEKVFLQEALDCYAVRAFRATIVMTWNLAFSRLKSFILDDTQRLEAFNTSLATKWPKKSFSVNRDIDFENLKEFEVIEIVKHAKIVSANVTTILQEKLRRRNVAAHPSKVKIGQAQVDDFVSDLMENIVLPLR